MSESNIDRENGYQFFVCSIAYEEIRNPYENEYNLKIEHEIKSSSARQEMKRTVNRHTIFTYTRKIYNLHLQYLQYTSRRKL